MTPAARGHVLYLAGPWENASLDKIMSRWGCPEGHDFDLLTSGLIHHRDAGAGTYLLPPTEEFLVFAAKAAKKKGVHPYMILLGYLALFSQYPIKQVMDLVLPRLRELNPLIVLYQESAEEVALLEAVARTVQRVRQHSTLRRLA